MRLPITSRYRAFAVHLSLSVLIFSIVISVLILAWYPPPYYLIDGLWQGLRIAASVDLILGPLVTLVVFKPGKKGLKLDLACIAFFQAVALLYGTVTIFQQRPYFVVYGDAEFRTVRWSDIVNQGRPAEELKALHASVAGKPPIIVVRPPSTPQEQAAMVQQVMTGKVWDYSMMAKRYEPISPKNWPQIAETALKQEALSSSALQAAQDFCAKQHCSLEKVAIFGLGGRFDDRMIVFDRDTGTLLGYLNEAPESTAVKRPRPAASNSDSA